MIDIVFLDNDFKLCGTAIVAFKNLTWNREYYECGKFTLELHSKYYFEDAKYVYAKNRDEVGVIERIQVIEDGKNENISLSGFFAENILNDEIIYPTFYGNSDLDTSIYSCFSTYKNDLPINSNPVPINDASKTWQATGDELGRKFYELLKPAQKSYKVYFNKETQMLEFKIYQGVDRTHTVVFGKQRKNIIRLQADFDNSNFKNYFVIAGRGEGSSRKIATLDLSSGEYKKKLFINASSIAYDETETTEEEYKQMLLQFGLEKSEKYLKIQDIATIPNKNIFQYLNHYNLGDKITVHVAELNTNFEARIVGIKEVVKNNSHNITLTFGEKKVTTLKKARLEN